MKKFLSLFLVLTMVLSMLTLPTMAAGEDPVGEPTTAPSYAFTPIPIEEETTEISYKGQTYKVIWTLADFFGMTATDGKAYYILGDNLDFTGATYKWNTVGSVTASPSYKYGDVCCIPGLINSTFHLEGNGKALNNVAFSNNQTGGGLFGTGKSGTHEITNLTVNTTSVSLTGNGSGLLYGQPKAPVTFTNVTVNVANFAGKASGNNTIAIFAAKVDADMTFNNCVLNGTISLTGDKNYGKGAFIGLNPTASTITFNDCDFAGDFVTENGGTAPYIGWVSAASTVNFNRCDVSGTLTVNAYKGGGGVSGYVGFVNADDATFNYTDCDLSGEFTLNPAQCAGYFGIVKNNDKVTFLRCKASGKFTAAGDYSAAYVGHNSSTATIDFIGCDATGTYKFNANSGVFLGYNTGASTVGFQSCTLNATGTAQFGAKSGGFVGYAESGSFDFDDCTASGNYSFTAEQAAAFFGQLETAGAVTFDKCDFDGNIVSTANDSVGPYVGMVNKADAVVTFNTCTSSGTFVQVRKYSVDYNRGWATGFVSCAGNGSATVNFNSCSTDMLLVGYGNVAGFVGSTKNTNGQMKYNFSGCTSNVTILSGGGAGAFVAEDLDVVTYDMMGCTDNSTIIAASNNDLSEMMDVVNANVKLYDVASGELAYKLAEAQAALEIDAKYTFGQTVGTDTHAYVGGAAVYEHETLKVGKVYSNKTENYVDTVDCTEAPKAYVQFTTPDGEGKFNTRVIIAVSEAKLAEIDNVTITLTFKTGEAVVKTKTFGKGGIDSYYAVYAGDQLAQAAEGYVLVAVTVTGIPTAEWSNETGTVSVSMAAFDANGDAMPEYTLA